MRLLSTFALGCAALGLWGLTVLLWMLHVAGHDIPALARGIVILALLASAVWVVVRLIRAWSWRSGRERALMFLLPALLVLSLAVRFTGFGPAVDCRYYPDDGGYHPH